MLTETGTDSSSSEAETPEPTQIEMKKEETRTSDNLLEINSEDLIKNLLNSIEELSKYILKQKKSYRNYIINELTERKDKIKTMH